MGMTRGRTSAALSLCIHAGCVALLLLIGSYRPPPSPATPQRNFVPLASPRFLRAPARDGGGGGGNHSPTPVNRGTLPRRARAIFIPPILTAQNVQPKLVIQPALELPADVPNARLPIIGDPNGVPGPPSNGPGSGGGLGDGDGKGAGGRHGPGYGNDDGYGIASAHAGHTTPPMLMWKIDPDYSEEARKAHFQGEVMLHVDIGIDGRPFNLRVAQPLGLGLDEKAMEAVSHWKFRPGMRNGKPVVMPALIEVHFRLL